RQTTPQLAQTSAINFPDMHSCGTSTEVSLPCLFSPYGRHDYDEKKIRAHQSLLHVLDHAGIGTLWRDNQSGCKGVCEGLPMQALDDATRDEVKGKLSHF
ncbi:sulfatase-like hydrolase/transferase, partial [Mycobacterium tuberculosis]|nr:sulfatase-like hydrolase/transferase [Mycobacterium tuberculosis]